MLPMEVANYTPDQEGQYIKDDDVVRPKNKRYAVKCSTEVSTWHHKSRACCPTYIAIAPTAWTVDLPGTVATDVPA